MSSMYLLTRLFFFFLERGRPPPASSSSCDGKSVGEQGGRRAVPPVEFACEAAHKRETADVSILQHVFVPNEKEV